MICRKHDAESASELLTMNMMVKQIRVVAMLCPSVHPNDDSHDHYDDDAGDDYEDSSNVVNTCSSKGRLAQCKHLLVHLRSGRTGPEN